MRHTIGIRREDKSKWERRVPLIPQDVKELTEVQGIDVTLQPSSIRVFPDDEYLRAAAKIQEDLSVSPVVFAVKEIPVEFWRPFWKKGAKDDDILGFLSNCPPTGP